jgi:hypothetical protein
MVARTYIQEHDPFDSPGEPYPLTRDELRWLRRANYLRELVNEVCCTSAKFLTGNEKIVFRAVAQDILFSRKKRDHGFVEIKLEHIASDTGIAKRSEKMIERMIQMGLFLEQGKEHLPGTLWLAIPDDIYERLARISSDFARKWHAPKYCENCRKNVVPRIRMRTHLQSECPHCQSLLEESYTESVYFMGDKQSEEEISQEEFLKREHTRKDEGN